MVTSSCFEDLRYFCIIGNCFQPPVSQGPEEMCLSLEHVELQNLSKTSEKMGYFDRVTVS